MLGNVTPVEVVNVTDSESSKQPVAIVATGELPIVSTGQLMVEEYKEVIASLEKGNIELVSVNEQLSGRVSSLEKENSEELQRLRAEVQALKEEAIVDASQDVAMPGEEEKDEGALNKHHFDDEEEEGEKLETDEEESEGEKEVATVTEELQASTSQLEILPTDKIPVVTSPQSEVSEVLLYIFEQPV